MYMQCSCKKNKREKSRAMAALLNCSCGWPLELISAVIPIVVGAAAAVSSSVLAAATTSSSVLAAAAVAVVFAAAIVVAALVLTVANR